MSKHAIVVAAATAAFLISGVVAQAAATSSSMASMTSMAAPAKPAAPAPVSLTCAVTSGDVSQTITITNSTTADIAKGTKISWVLGKHKGSTKLTAILAANATTTVRGPAGSVATCTATFVPPAAK